ncbi:polymorphic toxin type 50 domain-containing protein [Finegoldia magna]
MTPNGKSYLFDNVNPQELLNKYACNGIIKLHGIGNKTNKEIAKLIYL